MPQPHPRPRGVAYYYMLRILMHPHSLKLYIILMLGFKGYKVLKF